MECYALAHIVGTRVEAAFVEAECVKMQDALIREEEELEREEVCVLGWVWDGGEGVRWCGWMGYDVLDNNPP